MHADDDSPAAVPLKRSPVGFGLAVVAGTFVGIGFSIFAITYLVTMDIRQPIIDGSTTSRDAPGVIKVLSLPFLMINLLGALAMAIPFLIGFVMVVIGILLFAALGLWKLSDGTFKQCERWTTIVGAVVVFFMLLHHLAKWQT